MFYLSSFDYEPALATSLIKDEAVILTEWITVVFFSIIIFSNFLCVVSNLFWPPELQTNFAGVPFPDLPACR